MQGLLMCGGTWTSWLRLLIGPVSGSGSLGHFRIGSWRGFGLICDGGVGGDDLCERVISLCMRERERERERFYGFNGFGKEKERVISMCVCESGGFWLRKREIWFGRINKKIDKEIIFE